MDWLIYIITFKYFKRSIPESIIWALTVALSNHVTLLLPITEIYFQQNVISQVATIILMDGVILLSVIAFLELSTKSNVNLFIFLKNLISNPMILSIIIGLLFVISNFNIDETPIEYTLSKLAACVSPVGLFAIGIILSFIQKMWLINYQSQLHY